MTPRQRAREAVNWVVDNKHGAWGGVLLQTEWLTNVVEAAIHGDPLPVNGGPPRKSGICPKRPWNQAHIRPAATWPTCSECGA